MDRKSIDLQPLRITGGWDIIQNKFLNLEPSEIVDEDDRLWFHFTEDILQLRHKSRNIVIDMGWYPDIEPTGNYRIVAIKDEDWETPLDRFESRSKEEITAKIEQLIKQYSQNLKL